MNEHIKTSFDYMKRAPFQALAAISVLSLTFFVSTLLAVLAYSSHQILRYFETRPQIIAFVKTDTQVERIDELKTQLEKDLRIKSLKYVSKEEALEIYKKATSDNPLLGELVSPSIFPASLEFSVVDLKYTQEIIDEIKKEDFIEGVSFTANLGGESSLGDVITRLRNVSYYVRIGGAATASVLIATSFLVLMVVMGMRIAVRKLEIESLGLIGATNWFIRLPIILEAINYAVIGALFGWLMAFVLMLYTTPSILNYFAEIPVLPRESTMFFGLFGLLLLVELLIGIVLALIGSMIAVSRSLRMLK
jgi:cell division transport system permease protein